MRSISPGPPDSEEEEEEDADVDPEAAYLVSLKERFPGHTDSEYSDHDGA